MTGFSPTAIGNLGRVVRHSVLDWFWTRYHNRRHRKLVAVFHSVFEDDDTFMAGVEGLDEFQRWDLSRMIESRMQSCRIDDRDPGLTPADREKLQRRHLMIMDRMERGRRLLTEILMRDLR